MVITTWIKKVVVFFGGGGGPDLMMTRLLNSHDFVMCHMIWSTITVTRMLTHFT